MDTLTKIGLLGMGLLASVPALAGLKDIHTDKLPQSPAVQRAYSDALKAEEMVKRWSVKWPYETPKKQVASVIKNCLAELEKASVSAPNNAELLLLTGLVARYAYNMDVKDSDAVTIQSLTQASSLLPGDPRPQWFLGTFECESVVRLQDGMEKLLAIENAHPWDKLPAGFWDDYLECAVHSNMPAHGLRAANRTFALTAEPSRDREIYIKMLRERIKYPDASASYPAREVWYSDETGKNVTFTNTMFGLSVTAAGDWPTAISDIQNGMTAQFQIGPYPGNEDMVTPNILVLARPPKPDETLADFLSAIIKDESHQPVTSFACPVQEWLAFEAVRPGAYGKDGDGRGFFVAFHRQAPEYPGVLFERPSGPPPPPKHGKVQRFRPTSAMHRVAGEIYYLVLLDTAESVPDKAMLDYQRFLKSMQVE